MTIKTPSRTVLEMLHLVDTCGVSPAVAGRPYGWSAERVQIELFDARRFIGQHGATRMWGIPPQFAEYHALQHATERLTFLEREAIGAWRSSRGEQTSQRTQGIGTTTVTRTSHGDPRYLHSAIKIAQVQVKLAKDIARVYGELVSAGTLPQFDDSAVMEMDYEPVQSLEAQLTQAATDCMDAYRRMRDIEAAVNRAAGGAPTSNPCARDAEEDDEPAAPETAAQAATAAVENICDHDAEEVAATTEPQTEVATPVRATPVAPVAPPAPRPFQSARARDILSGKVFAESGRS